MPPAQAKCSLHRPILVNFVCTPFGAQSESYELPPGMNYVVLIEAFLTLTL